MEHPIQKPKIAWKMKFSPKYSLPSRNAKSSVKLQNIRMAPPRKKFMRYSACTVKIGCLDPHERCETMGIFENRAVVLYTVNGTGYEKVGFVKWLGGCKQATNSYKDKIYQNGSSREPVYADNSGQTRIGSLDPH